MRERDGTNHILLVIAVFGLVASPAPGHDLDGHYKDSALHDWFEHLASGKGPCCAFADGHALEDSDWRTSKGHYQVRLPARAGSQDMIWIDVPDAAVITEPNKLGRTMVWPAYEQFEFTELVSIRCFMPGSMARIEARPAPLRLVDVAR